MIGQEVGVGRQGRRYATVRGGDGGGEQGSGLVQNGLSSWRQMVCFKIFLFLLKIHVKVKSVFFNIKTSDN